MNSGYLNQAKQAALKALLPRDRSGNVVGIGIGTKNGDDCLRIYVVSARTRDGRPEEVGPPGFLSSLGVPTDVVEIGRLGRNGRAAAAKTPAEDIRRPGSSIRVNTKAPNVNSGATGTLGMVVSYANERYILGCNHVLAVNGRIRADPKALVVSAEFIGDEPTIADPDVHVQLERNGDNTADCALARLNGYGKVSAAFPAGFGDLKPCAKDPQPRMRVKKLGAATGITHGTIADVAADLDVDYDFGTYRFVDQIVIEGDKDEFATAGDSGSIIVEEESPQPPVGMVFAASGKYAIACPLSEVLKSLLLQLQNGKRGNDTLNLVFHDA